MELDLTHCPDCGLPAEVIDRAVLPSTDGPIEHVKTRCITGHWYLTPVDYDVAGSTRQPTTAASRRRG